MTIKFEQKLTKEEWLDFNRIYFKYKNKKARSLLLVLIGLCIIFFVLSLFLIWSYFQKPELNFVTLSITNLLKYYPLGFFDVVLFLLLTCAFAFRYRFQLDIVLNKMLKDPRNVNFFPEQAFYLDNSLIEVSSDSTCTKTQWKAFVEVIETDNYLVFVKNSANSIMIRKSGLMYYEIEQINSLITSELSSIYTNLCSPA